MDYDSNVFIIINYLQQKKSGFARLFHKFATKWQVLVFRNKIIQSFSAVFVIVMLLFSITPKRFLHDLIADHKDTVTIATNDGKDHIDHHGFRCDCDNLVATSPFISQDIMAEPLTPTIENSFFTTYTSGSKAAIYYNFSLRGPPAQAYSFI